MPRPAGSGQAQGTFWSRAQARTISRTSASSSRWDVHCGHRRERVRQENPGQRHPVQRAGQELNGTRTLAGGTRASPACEHLDKVVHVDQSPDRPHPAVQPGDLHRDLRRRPDPVRRNHRGQGARLPAWQIQLQRQGRPVRGVRGRRHDQDRDAVPARRVCHLRRSATARATTGDPRGQLPRQEHRRRARSAVEEASSSSRLPRSPASWGAR